MTTAGYFDFSFDSNGHSPTPQTSLQTPPLKLHPFSVIATTPPRLCPLGREGAVQWKPPQVERAWFP